LVNLSNITTPTSFHPALSDPLIIYNSVKNRIVVKIIQVIVLLAHQLPSPDHPSKQDRNDLPDIAGT
jgi:hypothetical protein